jgi:hypothetical protein
MTSPSPLPCGHDVLEERDIAFPLGKGWYEGVEVYLPICACIENNDVNAGL